MFIKRLTEAEFIAQFKKMGRGKQFTTEGLKGLFRYHELGEREHNAQWELDVIAICCSFAEVAKSDKNELLNYKSCDIAFRTVKTVMFET